MRHARTIDVRHRRPFVEGRSCAWAARACRPAQALRGRSSEGLERLAALALASTLLAGCAGQKQLETPPARGYAEATLKVVNATRADIRVEAEGRALGTVPAGREQYFLGLAPGSHDLRGRSPDGALSFRRDLLTLGPGETFTWILREGEAGLAQVAGAPGREEAAIVVENGTEWDVDVWLDSGLLGHALAGRSRRFEQVPTGAHRLEARAAGTSFPREFPVLEPGETFTWRLRGPGPIAGRGLLPAPGTGRLRVENPNRDAVTVRVNGVELGDVAARDVRIFDNLAADRLRLSAESVDGLTRYDGPELVIEPGGVALWRVGAGAGREGGGEVRVPAGSGLPPPPAAAGRGPSARPPDEGDAGRVGGAAPDVAQAPVEPRGAEPVESRGAAGKAFVVENHTGRDLEIFFDGQSAGAVGAGMTRRFTELPGPRFIPSAASASGGRRYPHPEVDLSGRDSFSWIIEP